MNKELTLTLVETTDNQGRPTYTLNGVDVCDSEKYRDSRDRLYVELSFKLLDANIEVLNDYGEWELTEAPAWVWGRSNYRIARPAPKPVSRPMNKDDWYALTGTLQRPVWVQDQETGYVHVVLCPPACVNFWSTDPRGPWYPCKVIDGKIGGVVTPTEPKGLS